MPVSEVFNENCLVGMARYPNDFFELAIVDGPYGIGEDGRKNHTRGDKKNRGKDYRGMARYDDEPISAEILKEIFRVSKNQIIWGANHFISRMPYDSSCWIVWDKVNTGSDFADCELAWTSFKTAIRQVRFMWNGAMQGCDFNGRAQGNKSLNEVRIHPNQKPVALGRWLLDKYGKPGDKILDTHMGSQSFRIASHQKGFDYYGWEIDEKYFNDGNARFKKETSQLTIFDIPAISKAVPPNNELFFNLHQFK